MSKQGQKAAARRNKELAEEALPIAKQLCPKDSGALADTITVEVNNRTGGADLVAGDENVDYAVHVELGTENMDAQPFLRPAAEIVAKKSRNRKVRAYK